MTSRRILASRSRAGACSLLAKAATRRSTAFHGIQEPSRSREHQMSGLGGFEGKLHGLAVFEFPTAITFGTCRNAARIA